MMLVMNPLRRWWQAAFAPAAVPAVAFRLPPTRPRRTVGMTARAARPITPFRAAPTSRGSVEGARRAARRFWMTLDPQDQRRAAIGGSFAEVCAALERLAAVEER